MQQFREMADKILSCQQADGLWRSSLLDPENYPLKETSGSGFYAYALAWGINQGVLDRERFGPAVSKAWRGLVGCVTPEGKLTHVQPIGADPKKFDVSHSDVYGVGAFLLAGSEVYRMLGGAVPSKPAGVIPSTKSSRQNPEGAFKRVVSRYRQTIGRDPDRSLQDTGTIDLAQVKSWMKSCNADGSWSDIDYQNQDRASWKACLHLDRLRLLAMVWADADRALRGDKELEAVIWRALDYWLANGVTNPNWWWNQIGVPGKMCDIIVLLDEHLQGDRRTKALRILAQAGKPRAGGGANTLWIADLAMQYAALTADAGLLKECRDIINGEIRIGPGEGIQPDLSFHQHGARLQQFAYGRAYLMTSARAAWQLAGSPWALPEDRLEILARFAVEGDQWMCRGIDTVPSTLDRSVSRPNALKWGDVRSALEQLAVILPSRRDELGRFLARQNRQAEPLVGARAFPYSDFSTHHRPGFSFFLKTLSNRTLATETGLNSEHLLGRLQNLGDHYLVRDGEEYFNLSPVWNWNLLPGLTVAGSMAGPLPRPFTGTTTDGTSSASVMDCEFGTTNNVELSARKLWVCHGDLIVALIGDLRFTSPQQARTALDQCRLREPVWVDDGAGPRELQSDGNQSGGYKWVYHSGFAYLPLEGALSVQAGTVTGSWAKVNAALSPAPVSAPVLLVSMDHPQTDSPQNTGYVLAHVSKSEAEKLSREPSWEVQQNDSTAQVVRFKDGTVAAAFYEPCRLSFSSLAIAVDQPCLLLRRGGEVWVSDASHRGLKLNLTLNEESRSCRLPADGTSVRWQ
jgi:chondroitin AC lyase